MRRALYLILFFAVLSLLVSTTAKAQPGVIGNPAITTTVLGPLKVDSLARFKKLELDGHKPITDADTLGNGPIATKKWTDVFANSLISPTWGTAYDRSIVLSQWIPPYTLRYTQQNGTVVSITIPVLDTARGLDSIAALRAGVAANTGSILTLNTAVATKQNTLRAGAGTFIRNDSVFLDGSYVGWQAADSTTTPSVSYSVYTLNQAAASYDNFLNGVGTPLSVTQAERALGTILAIRSGSAWTKDTFRVDNSTTVLRTDIITSVSGRNLFNKNGVTTNRTIQTSTSNLIASANVGDVVSNLMPVVEGQTFIAWGYNTVDYGSTDPATTDNTGMNFTAFPAQGTGNKTGGVQIAVPTTGQTGIKIGFDIKPTAVSSRYYTVQYTTDISAGTPVWVDFATDSFTTGDVFITGRSYDMSAVTALNNNANAGFRVVATFKSGTSTYVAANTGSTWATTGTWRFDMLTVRGTASAVVTQWNFNSLPPDASNSTGSSTASTGTGTLTAIGSTTTTFATAASAGLVRGIGYYKANGDTVSPGQTGPSDTSRSFTFTVPTGRNIAFARVMVSRNGFANDTATIQVEAGSFPTFYEPYQRVSGVEKVGADKVLAANLRRYISGETYNLNELVLTDRNRIFRSTKASNVAATSDATAWQQVGADLDYMNAFRAFTYHIPATLKVDWDWRTYTLTVKKKPLTTNNYLYVTNGSANAAGVTNELRIGASSSAGWRINLRSYGRSEAKPVVIGVYCSDAFLNGTLSGIEAIDTSAIVIIPLDSANKIARGRNLIPLFIYDGARNTMYSEYFRLKSQDEFAVSTSDRFKMYQLSRVPAFNQYQHFKQMAAFKWYLKKKSQYIDYGTTRVGWCGDSIAALDTATTTNITGIDPTRSFPAMVSSNIYARLWDGWKTNGKPGHNHYNAPEAIRYDAVVKNIYDATRSVTNTTLSATGVIATTANANDIVSGWTPIVPGATYFISGLPTVAIKNIAYFDVDSVFISSQSTSGNATFLALTAPYNAQFIRHTVCIQGLTPSSTIQLERGTAATTYQVRTKVFTETGSGWAEAKFNAAWDIYSSGTGNMRRRSQCSMTNGNGDAVSFSWGTAYERLFFLDKLATNGTTSATFSVSGGSGLAQVRVNCDTCTWYEANGFNFSQVAPAASTVTHRSNHIERTWEFKKVGSGIGTSLNITLTNNSASSSEYMNYMGVDPIKSKKSTINLFNCARSGANLREWRSWLRTEILDRDPDLTIFEITAINETLSPITPLDTTLAILEAIVWGTGPYGDGVSFKDWAGANWDSMSLLAILPHQTIGSYVTATGEPVILSNGVPVEQYYRSILGLFYSKGDVPIIDLRDGLYAFAKANPDWADLITNLYAAPSAAGSATPSTYSKTGYSGITSDGIHLNNLGCELIADWIIGPAVWYYRREWTIEGYIYKRYNKHQKKYGTTRMETAECY